MMRFLTELFVVGFSIQFDKIMDCLREIVISHFIESQSINMLKIIPKIKQISYKEARPLLLNVQTALMFSDRFGFEVLRRKGVRINHNYNKYDDLVNIFDYDQIVPNDKIPKVILFFQIYLNGLMDHLKNLYDVSF